MIFEKKPNEGGCYVTCCNNTAQSFNVIATSAASESQLSREPELFTNNEELKYLAM